MKMPEFETGEAWLIGEMTEEKKAEVLTSFLDDFFSFCSDRMAYLMNSGDRKLILGYMDYYLEFKTWFFEFLNLKLKKPFRVKNI